MKAKRVVTISQRFARAWFYDRNGDRVDSTRVARTVLQGQLLEEFIDDVMELEDHARKLEAFIEDAGAALQAQEAANGQ